MAVELMDRGQMSEESGHNKIYTITRENAMDYIFY